jgi:dTDP-glucose 4,6-dehydratase
VRADVRDRAKMAELFREHDITHVVNFAAEPHVDRSIVDPEVFLSTNILARRRFWTRQRQAGTLRRGTNTAARTAKTCAFCRCPRTKSTARSAPKEIHGNDALAPNSPYSAAKAGADLVCRAYGETSDCRSTYALLEQLRPLSIPEKLIPLMITTA